MLQKILAQQPPTQQNSMQQQYSQVYINKILIILAIMVID